MNKKTITSRGRGSPVQFGVFSKEDDPEFTTFDLVSDLSLKCY
jgi:hypothetical protein